MQNIVTKVVAFYKVVGQERRKEVFNIRIDDIGISNIEHVQS
jgi:hypothetical protein